MGDHSPRCKVPAEGRGQQREVEAGAGRRGEEGTAEPHTSCVRKQPHPLSTEHPQEPP